MKKLAALLVAAAALGVAGCGGGNNDSAQAPFDRAFIDALVPHHQAAIEMARAARQAGVKQPELVTIADDIIVTQQAEIEQMLDWREQWFGSKQIEPQTAALEVLGLSAAAAGIEHSATALAAADVDQAFAGMMIGHHTGALRMAELATEKADHDEIRQLADNIITAQQHEIDILEKHALGRHG